MSIYILVFLLLVCVVYILLNIPAFGRLPRAGRLERIKNLETYDKGAIRNHVDTPDLQEGVTYFDILKAMLKGNPNAKPPAVLPYLIPDLNVTFGTQVSWFGHSSYLLQVEKLKILVDPVFSHRTSPFPFIGNKNYEGTDFITAENFDAIDILLITHDHYDHLDMQSIRKLKDKVAHFITSLGVAEHLERWGVPADQITELAWDEQISIFGLKFTAAPARHFSGRKFKRGQTLWSSFILETPSYKIYLGGDSGYGDHFKKIGEQHGPFDLAILECGQYNIYWPYIHMFPEQVVQAAKELQADLLLPVHWAKFTLALHDWDDPILRVVKCADELHQKITTPLLGEPVVLGADYPITRWWLNIDGTKQ